MPIEKDVKDLLITIRQNLLVEGAKSTLTIQERIRGLRQSGMSDNAIRELFRRDFISQNPIFFSQFKNAVKEELAGGIHRADALGAADELGDGTPCKWTTVGDDNVCEDCEDREGQVRTLAEWKLLGLPKSGFSRCQHRCRCEITPESAGAPARVNLKALAEAEVEKGLSERDQFYESLKKDLNIERILYHGTSAKNAAAIQSEGIRSTSAGIFFSSTISIAQQYAGATGVVFKVRVPESEVGNFLGTITVDRKKYLPKGTLIYVGGNVPTTWIEGVA